MYDKIDHRPFACRYDSEPMESESETHPLMSSDASHASRGSFQGTFMFHDSETSDVDNPAPGRRQMHLPSPAVSRPQHLSHSQTRRPFVFANDNDKLDDDSLIAMTANRYQYYNKLRSYINIDDPALLIPEHVLPPYLSLNNDGKGKQSSIVTIFTIWNTILGSSLLAMPWGIEQSGLFTGLLIMLLMGGLCLYTTYRILEVHKLHGSGDPDGEVAELSRYLLGRPAEMIAKSFSVVVLVGAIIAYWILMSNFLYNSINYIYDFITGDTIEPALLNHTVFPVTCPRYFINTTEDGATPEEEVSTFHKIWNLHTVPIFLVPIIGSLINFKNVTFFTKLNSLGTLSVMYVILFVIVKSISWGVNIEFKDISSPIYSPQFLPGFPVLSGMLAMSFFIHNIIISIMRNNRNQENNGRDLTIAYILVTLTYTLVGAAFYICFPLAKSCIEDNLLNNFYSWDIMTVFARVFLLFQLVTVYPLLIFMLRSQLFTALLHNPYPGLCPVIILNAGLITVCVLFAIFLPRIGTIIRFTGALSGLVYVFTLPSLLHLASQKKNGNTTTLSTVIHLAIPVIGGINLFAQFFVSDN